MTSGPVLLLDMTLKASLLCLFGFALAPLLRRASGSFRHDLWAALLVSCAILPLAVTLWRNMDFAPSIAPVHQAAMAVTARLPASAPAGVLETIDRIWSGDGDTSDLSWRAALIIGLWAAGVAASITRGLASYYAAVTIARRARPFACELAPPGVRVRITPELTAPAVFGVASPTILLPREAANWSEERLRAVLAHEAAHVMRRDCSIELLLQSALALHWFNLLVRSAARRLRSEREIACDERAVGSGVEVRSYAAALVDVAREAGAVRHAALLAMARGPELERRVLLLLDSRRALDGHVALRRALALATVLVFTAFAAVTAPMAQTLGAGSVQPTEGPLSGLDDPMSERVPLDYSRLAPIADRVPGIGPEAAAIKSLKTQLDRQSHGYGDLVRERSIWALGQVRGGQLFAPLSERVGESDWRVSAYAAWGLAATADRRATPLLTAMLDDPVWRVRAMAAAALAQLADPAAAGPMMAAANDPAWQVRISVVDYADRVADPTLLARIRPLLRDAHAGTRLRAEAALNPR